jgi:predicted porin
MNKKTTIAIQSILASGLLIATSTHAIEFKLSGQVSRMIVAPDDDSGDSIQHQDIGWSGSRFRFTGEENLENGLTAGFRLEQQLQSNPSFASAGANQTNGGNDDFIDNRYQDIYLKGGFGKVSIGKGDGAANGGTESDLSGTALSSSSNHQDNWGNYIIVAGENPEDNVTWDSIFTMNDGISRVNRLRYDTPSFSGASAAISFDQGDAVELALRFKTDIGGTKINSAVFYVDAADFANDAEVLGLSASFLHASGFNLTFAFSDRDNSGNTPDQEATTLKLGYKTGVHAVSVDFGVGERGNAEADTTGITYSATLGSGIESFITYRQLGADIAFAEDVQLLALGGRIRF